jgi:demethylmenaquinone methyltransferase / 2-methoxy-6-polyprenyl-1,4-benzoquinol methylase
MTPLSEPQCLRVMRERFKIIAPRYDFVTRAFSYGRDRRWKSLGVEKASLSDDAAVLDLACGTGDFSQLVLERLPHARVVGMDLTEPMLHMARKRGLTETVCGDGTSLPFADGSFDCVFVGYGLRNFPDLNEALREIERVTRPGGLMVSLDFFLPANRGMRMLFLVCLYVQGAIWGLLLHGNPMFYAHIPDSLQRFVSIEEFSTLLQHTSYDRIEAREYFFGGIALHWAVRR